MLAKLLRRDVTFTVEDGAVTVRGWRQLSTGERDTLRGVKTQVLALLLAKARRRQQRELKKQQQLMAQQKPQPPERKVIGQIVTAPGEPVRLLYADEVREIPAHAQVRHRGGWFK